ncbi:MAG: LysR substrate-binding domain-containing protein [Solimonas sp.]
MTLRELRYLVAVADHGHFGRAAAACHVSQPTLSTQLRKLEAYLGAPLIERGGRNVQLTALGEQAVLRARAIVREAEQLIATTRARAAPLAGPLNIGIITTLSPYFLPWLLPMARARFAALQLVVREDLTPHLIECLRAHRIEAAMLALPLDSDEFDSRPLFDEPFWLACPRNHRFAALPRVPAEALHDERLLLLTDGHCLRGQALAVCGLHHAVPAAPFGDFRATSLETLSQLVASGLGCTLLPALATGAAAQSGLAIRPLATPAARRIGLVWRRHCPRRVEFELLAKAIAEQPPKGTRRVGRMPSAGRAGLRGGGASTTAEPSHAAG